MYHDLNYMQAACSTSKYMRFSLFFIRNGIGGRHLLFHRKVSETPKIIKFPKSCYIFPVALIAGSSYSLFSYYLYKKKASENHTFLQNFPSLEECPANINQRFKVIGTLLLCEEKELGPCGSFSCSHPYISLADVSKIYNTYYHRYTPFVLKNTGKKIYVDRGYIGKNDHYRLLNPCEDKKSIDLEICGYLVKIPKYDKRLKKHMVEKLDYDNFCIRADQSMTFDDNLKTQNVYIYEVKKYFAQSATMLGLFALMGVLSKLKRTPKIK